MSDSNGRDELEDKHERIREQRIEAVKRWAEYVKKNPPETWGAQQNALVDSQIQSARDSGLDPDQYARIREAVETDRP